MQMVLEKRAERYELLIDLLAQEKYSAKILCEELCRLRDQNIELEKENERLEREIPGETITIDGEELPRALSATYTNSLGEKAKLRAMLEGWRGRSFTAEELMGFDLSKLVGIGCMIGVTHARKTDGGEYVKISSVSKLPKGFAAPALQNLPVVFDLDAPDAIEKLALLPEWVKNRVKESETWKRMFSAPDGSGPVPSAEGDTALDTDEDLPF